MTRNTKPRSIETYDGEERTLLRITDGARFTNRQATDKELASGRNVGAAVKKNCWICRKYLKENGGIVNQQTVWQCSKCGMPICRKDRTKPEIGRMMTCFEEHERACDRVLGCFDEFVDNGKFPPHRQINLYALAAQQSRRSTRNRR